MAAFDIDKIVLDFLYGRLGTPYIYGGAGPYYDCSGLVIECLKMRGWVASSFDATAHDLFNRTMSGGTLKPKAHALSFYGTEQRITHVGYCISETHMIEAGGGGASTTSLEAALKLGAMVRVRPIYYRKDFIACHLPERIHFS
jgi:hypothetical protein